MARAETIETVGENGGGRNGPLSLHNTCRMELPQPLHNRPGPRTEPSVHNTPPHREPLLGLYLPNQLPYSHPEGHQQPPALSPAPSCRLETSRRTASRDSSQEEPDSNKEEQQDASRQQGPLPDLLPQNEHSSWDSPPQQLGVGGEAAQQLDVIRVAGQLRMIGDQFNAMILHRAHIAPQWQDWREVCLGFLDFVAQSLSTLYRLT
ncbi:bcl-2-binding component 3 [Poecilia reticulata]|uniref:bcl-2-binding component 3 n=1 Tax=Poecilia reticulata TaxID=8081 RepID=UPI0004A394AB|nr:PREDICTED: uncharacterized protein LOC103475207 [Poecilia reticulata]XP_008424869.1 PREDICTED: uncharacterized protein LOC103475207 [Poecilia reticulata]